MSEPKSQWLWRIVESADGATLYVAHPEAPPVALVIVDGKITLHTVSIVAEPLTENQERKR